jgi:translation initiation factor 2-alpha kinase 4
VPLIGVDMPVSTLSQMALDPSWINEEEAWRSLLSGMKPGERGYMDSIRDAVKEVKAKSGGSLWLFSVRESRVSSCSGCLVVTC